MGAGDSSLSMMPAERIDAASLHALAVSMRKPALVCQIILEHEIDGLTALELDDEAITELGLSKLDQKKVSAALKQFRNVVEDSTLSRRVADLEAEVYGRKPRLEPESLEDRIRILEDEILALCDAAPNGSMLAANLPRLYYYRYGRNLDFRSLGFLKLSQLLAKMSRLEFDGNHRALVSKKIKAFEGEDLLPSYILRDTFMQ